jgi:hypothetical protein
MKIYFSEFQIPEFQRLPVEEARNLWQSCLQTSPARNLNVALMVALILGAYFFDVSGVWLGAAFAVCLGLSQPILIALLRPRIRQILESRKNI